MSLGAPISIPLLTEANFQQEVLGTDLPVVVDFMASWCGPCKTMAPEFEAAAAELAGRAKFVKVDIDQSRGLAQKLRIQSVPTTMVFVGGRLANAKAGAMRRNQIRELVEPFLPHAEGAITAAEAAEMLKRGQIVMVDTREAQVYQRRHIPGATHIPLEEIPTRLAELHMLPAPAVLYCRSGDKTKGLSDEMTQQGLTLPFLEGGMLAWESDGFPTE